MLTYMYKMFEKSFGRHIHKSALLIDNKELSIMLKRKYLSYLGLFAMLFSLASCEGETKKFEDTDNGLYYSQVKGLLLYQEIH